MPNRKRAWTLLLIIGVLAASPAPGAAQSDATIRVEENFRREPNGVVLARLTAGTPVRVVGRDGNWSQVEMRGWVWLRSLQASSDPDYDLVVSVDGGENLRAEPAGEVLARLEDGALLDELERNSAWASVSRLGWIWSASLEEAAEVAGPMIQPPAPDFEGPAAQRPGGFMTVGAGGGAILTSPDGDTLAVASPSSDLEVVGREGNWVRVRVEGWTWMPEAAPAVEGGGDDRGALEPADLAAAPSAFNGRVVSWTLQFISLERAEAVRTDFREGEPFLLTRFGGPEGPFVYVALPPERLPDIEGLVPLERISVTARIRTGASVLTDTPIVDLVSIERSREAP